MRRLALPLTAMILLALAATPAVADPGGVPSGPKPPKQGGGSGTTVGIADQSAATFTDPLFTSLGIKHARLNLAWDALNYDWQVAELDAWMANAQADGIQPLVIFSQSRAPGRTRILPTPAQLGAVVTKLRARYPFVKEFAAWNEMNYPGQPTFKRPQVVAQYYKTIRANCAGCTVLPGSLLDNPNVIPWAKQLLAAIKKLRQPAPAVWGLHNYSDVNRLRDTSTRKLLQAVRGRFWLTETGGVVRATSPTASKFPQGAPYAGKVTSYILGTMVRKNPRIERVYLYEWKAPAGPVSWDSGLVSPADQSRPAYDVVKQYLQTGIAAARR